ncbi:hypothetical protein GCM10009550_71600 [Actinocorallia libanotica]|uniref:Uncharacterized protein n=1 Tax=Actinocorallia libanotica TaxID=46162 RepID=A0ABP4CI59_9ACTN
MKEAVDAAERRPRVLRPASRYDREAEPTVEVDYPCDDLSGSRNLPALIEFGHNGIREGHRAPADGCGSEKTCQRRISRRGGGTPAEMNLGDGVDQIREWHPT